MRLGRTVPELDAELVSEPDEWRAAFILNKKPISKKVPGLNEVIRLIARLSGFLGRKGDGEPGTRTLWLGLQEVAIFVQGARYARAFSEAGLVCNGMLSALWLKASGVRSNPAEPVCMYSPKKHCSML